MAAITWQNINFPSSRDVGRELDGAQRGLVGGFDKLAEILQQREVVNQGVADRERAAGAQEYLNTLQGFKTPEELQAARMSGVLDQAFAKVDKRNQAEVRGAAEARIASLYGQVGAANKYAVDLEKAPVDLANAQADAANAPITRELARNVLLQRQAVEPITNRTALLTAGNAESTAQQTKTLFSQASANAAAALKLEATKLPVQQQVAENDAQDQLVQQLTTAAAQTHQNTQLAGRLALAPHAVKLGLPLDSSGSPDILNMSPEQRNQLDSAALKDPKVTRTTTDLYSGDTKVANSFLADILRKDPRVTPEAISRNQAKIVGAFSTVGTSAPVGNDAMLLDRKYAQTEVRIKEQGTRNRFTPGSPDALNAYEQLAKDLPGAVSADAQEDVPALQAMLGRLSTKGVEVSKGVWVTPSAQDIMSAVRGYTPNWKGNWFNNTQAEDIEKQLKETLKGTDVAELLKQREEALMFQRQKAVRELLNPVTPAMAPLNPLQLPPIPRR